MRGDLILLALGIFLGVFSTIGYQKVFGPSSYDECVLAKTKGWSLAERMVVERVCLKQFPWVNDAPIRIIEKKN